MKHEKFIGRKQLLSALKALLKKKTASLVVIKGRRRIGKSRLAEEFGKGHAFYSFCGLAPSAASAAQAQRNEFALRLSKQFAFPEVYADDWSKLFMLLADKVKSGRAIILFDEITWMADKDPTFLSKLKNAWDLYYKKNPQLILILCGSVSAWIEKNIINSTGFYGRISKKITLDELSLAESNALLTHSGFHQSDFEKFMLLSVVGGVPWYLEQIDPALTAVDNIQRLCFEPDGLLVDEFHHIFSDLFGRRGAICRKIVTYLVKGPAPFDEIATGIQYHSSGSLSEYLEDLMISGFIKRDYTWLIKTGEESKLSKFRLCDNYLRFYLRYMASKLNRIKKGQYVDLNLSALPGFQSILGLQFENLVLNNRRSILEKLNIKPEDVIYDNPFFQQKTARQKGCQIDYLIQTKYNTLYLCEIKFSQGQVKSPVIAQMKEKITRLSTPRNFACIPVLIHVNGLADPVKEAEYFGSLIDFSDLLG